jgi:hypothetical protein
VEFSINGIGKTGYTCQRLKPDPCHPVQKWIPNRSRILRPETLKQLEENIGKVLEDIGISNVFPNRTPIAQKIRIRIEKWNLIKLKVFTQQKIPQSIKPLQNMRKSVPAIYQIKD